MLQYIFVAIYFCVTVNGQTIFFTKGTLFPKPNTTTGPDNILGGTGTWGKWTKWSPCTRSCGGGMQTKTRVCKDGHSLCPGGAAGGFKTRPCNEQSCCVESPVPKEWGRWNRCPVTCGEGIQFRTRVCDNSLCPGEFCTEKLKEEKGCNAGCCPMKAEWSKWSEWSSCSASCDKGIKERTRKCSVDEECQKSPKDCIGPDKETMACGTKCCKKTANWSDWSEWSDCSVKCGAGEKNRSRTCVVSGTCKGKDPKCEGKSQDTMKCNNGCCPIGRWTEWSEWSPCSVSCDEGVKSRSRKCKAKKSKEKCPGVPSCEGDSEEEMLCKEAPCEKPGFGTWTKWSAWSQCSVSCGEGVKTRDRKCKVKKDKKKSPGVPSCEGDSEEEMLCKEAPCEKSGCKKGKWSDWQPWEQCSVSCGGGTKKRQRECEPRKKCPSSPKLKCKGKGMMTNECNTDCCPGPSEWSEWSEWSLCCNKRKSRTRSCVPDPECPGPSPTCEGMDTDKTKCKKVSKKCKE